VLIIEQIEKLLSISESKHMVNVVHNIYENKEQMIESSPKKIEKNKEKTSPVVSQKILDSISENIKVINPKQSNLSTNDKKIAQNLLCLFDSLPGLTFEEQFYGRWKNDSVHDEVTIIDSEEEIPVDFEYQDRKNFAKFKRYWNCLWDFYENLDKDSKNTLTQIHKENLPSAFTINSKYNSNSKKDTCFDFIYEMNCMKHFIENYKHNNHSWWHNTNEQLNLMRLALTFVLKFEFITDELKNEYEEWSFFFSFYRIMAEFAPSSLKTTSMGLMILKLRKLFKNPKSSDYLNKINQTHWGSKMKTTEDWLCEIGKSSNWIKELIFTNLYDSPKKILTKGLFNPIIQTSVDSLHNTKEILEPQEKKKEFSVENSDYKLQETKDLNLDQETYICNLCDKTFSRKDNYKRHVDTVHTDSCRFSCEICKKEFKWKSSCKKHLEKCKNKGTNLELKFITHKFEKVSKVKKYKCGECGKTYTRTSNLYAHQRNKH
jgi:hypothetical protein